MNNYIRSFGNWDDMIVMPEELISEAEGISAEVQQRAAEVQAAAKVKADVAKEKTKRYLLIGGAVLLAWMVLK